MPCHLFVILVNVKMLGKNEYLKKIISQYHNHFRYKNMHHI